jgi:hypothetical protein
MGESTDDLDGVPPLEPTRDISLLPADDVDRSVTQLAKSLESLSVACHDIAGSGHLAFRDRVTRPVEIAGQTLYSRGLVEIRMAEELVGLLVLFSAHDAKGTWEMEVEDPSVADRSASFDVTVTHYDSDGDVVMSNT